MNMKDRCFEVGGWTLVGFVGEVVGGVVGMERGRIARDVVVRGVVARDVARDVAQDVVVKDVVGQQKTAARHTLLVNYTPGLQDVHHQEMSANPPKKWVSAHQTCLLMKGGQQSN